MTTAISEISCAMAGRPFPLMPAHLPTKKFKFTWVIFEEVFMPEACYRMALLIMTALLASASQAHPSTAAQTRAPIAEDQQPAVRCPQERPAACSPDYQPVCGFIDSGIRCTTTPCPSWETHTFANGCSACTDERVLGFSDGICPQDADTAATETDPADDAL